MQAVIQNNADRTVTTFNAPLGKMTKNQRRVAILLAQGVTPPEIAAHFEMSEATVQRLRNHPNTEAWMRHIEQLARNENIMNREQFNELQQKAIKVYEKVLDDPKATHDQKLRVAAQVLDRHPDGVFIKGSRHNVETTHHLTNESILELKKRAQLVQAEVIEVLPSSDPTSDVPIAAGVAPDPLAGATLGTNEGDDDE